MAVVLICTILIACFCHSDFSGLHFPESDILLHGFRDCEKQNNNTLSIDRGKKGF